jgi:chemotaxis protein MotC
MKYYDWARLTAPGTIIEEAALRRSVSLAAEAGDPDKGFRYALNYARRYLTSPYASQFADVFVELAVTHFDEAVEKRVAEILAFMDQARQREVYLRVARRAAIAGNQTLARLASSRAEELARDGSGQSQLLASFYDGLAAVPSEDVFTAAERLAAIPDAKLSPRDRALRDAARAIADEVVRLPKDESPAQASVPIPEADIGAANNGSKTGETGSGMSPFAKAEAPTPVAEPPAGAQAAASDPALDGFVANGRSKIKEIDALLAEEGP